MEEFLTTMGVLFASTSVVTQSDACGSHPKVFLTYKETRLADACTMPMTYWNGF